MLTVAKITSGAAGGYADYLEGKATSNELGDYYLKDGERVEAPGRWVTAAGARAAGVDPEMPVSGDALRELMAVRRPDTGAPLRRVGASGEAVAAIDATFSAPKSVSAAWALADPELRTRIEAAHEVAVDRAVAYATCRVAMVRERVDKTTVRHQIAREIVATSWRHTTARAVAGRAPDPQLHSHVLLHGAVRRDERLVAIDSRAWFSHRREVGAAYRTELALELNRLGFAIVRDTGNGRRYFEIDGIPGELIDTWSSRHYQVQAAIQQRLQHKREGINRPETGLAAGASSPKRAALTAAEDRHLGRATRSAKRQLQTHEQLDRRWQADASRLGVSHAVVSAMLAARSPLAPAADREVLGRMTEFDATFTDRDARAVALEASAGAPAEKAIARVRGLEGKDELLRLADGRLTTADHRGRERVAADSVVALVQTRTRAIPSALTNRELGELRARLYQRGDTLTEAQADAIELACGDRPLVVIEGHAGSGKSTVLTAIARAHQADERRIVVTSTSGLAAQRLASELSDAEVHVQAFSTASLHAAIANGNMRIGPSTTVIHDEAALASTREQQRLSVAVLAHGGRLIEVGDHAQSQPVGAAGLWPQICDAARDEHALVTLADNVRALDPDDRRDQLAFRHHDPASAMRGYDARGRLVISADAEYLALQAAHEDRQRGVRTLVVTQTSNEHLDELNAHAQALRLIDGEVGENTVPLAGRPYGLRAGDQIQIRHNLHHPTVGQLNNGTTGRVADVDPEARGARLVLGDQTSVWLEREQLDRAQVRLGYVQHPFPAQGQTTDTTHVIAGEHASREGTYVALTRARTRTTIYAPDTPQALEGDPIVTLAERISQTEPDAPSIATPLLNEQQITAEYSEPRRQLQRTASRSQTTPTRAPAQRSQVPHQDGGEIARHPDEGRLVPGATRSRDSETAIPLDIQDPRRERLREAAEDRRALGTEQLGARAIGDFRPGVVAEEPGWEP